MLVFDDLGLTELYPMSWTRQTSQLEGYLYEVLAKAKTPLTLTEIVAKIRLKHPDAFTGGTPERSLYSVIYRREGRRLTEGLAPMLLKVASDRVVRYSLNPECSKADAGKRIKQP